MPDFLSGNFPPGATKLLNSQTLRVEHKTSESYVTSKGPKSFQRLYPLVFQSYLLRFGVLGMFFRSKYLLTRSPGPSKFSPEIERSNAPSPQRQLPTDPSKKKPGGVLDRYISVYIIAGSSKWPRLDPFGWHFSFRAWKRDYIRNVRIHMNRTLSTTTSIMLYVSMKKIYSDIISSYLI